MSLLTIFGKDSPSKTPSRIAFESLEAESSAIPLNAFLTVFPFGKDISDPHLAVKANCAVLNTPFLSRKRIVKAVGSLVTTDLAKSEETATVFT